MTRHKHPSQWTAEDKLNHAAYICWCMWDLYAYNRCRSNNGNTTLAARQSLRMRMWEHSKEVGVPVRELVALGHKRRSEMNPADIEVIYV